MDATVITKDRPVITCLLTITIITTVLIIHITVLSTVIIHIRV